MSDLLNNTLSNSAFWMVNKTIARQVGFNAAVLLADLISKRQFFKDRGELQPDGSFFNIAGHIEDDLDIGKEARIAAQKTLVSAGFLKIDRRGIPAKNYYLIQDEAIIGALEGKISRELDDQTSKNKTTGALETRPVIRINRNKNKASLAGDSSDSQEGRNTGAPKEAEGDRREATFSHLPENEEARELLGSHPDYRDQWALLPDSVRDDLAPCSDFDEFMGAFKKAVSKHLTGKSNPPPTTARPTSPRSYSNATPEVVLRAWRRSFGKRLDFITGKHAEGAMKSLAQTFFDNGLTEGDIDEKAVIKVCFGNMEVTPKIQNWQNDVREYLKNAIIDVYSVGQVKIVHPQATSLTNGFPSPEAEAIYNRLVSQGKTSTDCGGMSLKEYACQRAVAERFTPVDTTELEAALKKRQHSEDIDVEELISGSTES